MEFLPAPAAFQQSFHRAASTHVGEICCNDFTQNPFGNISTPGALTNHSEFGAKAFPLVSVALAVSPPSFRKRPCPLSFDVVGTSQSETLVSCDCVVRVRSCRR